MPALSLKDAIKKQKLFYKSSVEDDDFKNFKKNINNYNSTIKNPPQGLSVTDKEAYYEDQTSSFLKTIFGCSNVLRGHNNIDIVLTDNNKLQLVFEGKVPGSNEMITTDNLNKKALHQLVYYFMQEVVSKKNQEMKYLIATDFNNWFVFDAVLFHRLFRDNSNFRKDFEQFESGATSGQRTIDFYNGIAKPYITEIIDKLEYTHFNINNFKTDEDLKLLYKFFSPTFLLRKQFANDNNTLNKEFYNELLHFIGLEEKKENNKKMALVNFVWKTI